MDHTYTEQERERQVDVDRQGYGYFRNAVERHWDPYEIDLSKDRARVVEMVEEHGELALERMLGGMRAFAAGEEAVTEDLMPLARAMEDVEDEMYLTTQMYEEAKHMEFFDRYWAEVINPAEEELGLEQSSVTDFEDYSEEYWDLFERNERAQERLLTENTPENRAKAFCHYHLVLEGIAAQGGYFGLHALYGSDQVEEMPVLPGFAEGFSLIRQDEGRHVGFGMHKLKELVESGQVSPELINDTVDELVDLVIGLNERQERYADLPSLPHEVQINYITQKHTERMQQIVDASEDIPDVEKLTTLDGGIADD